MLIVVVLARFLRRVVTVEVADRGEFYCLACKADRAYELRTWRRVVGGGEFVLCNTCRTAFDPECLDESSTASLETLRDFPPRAALGRQTPPGAEPKGRLSTAKALREYLDS